MLIAIAIGGMVGGGIFTILGISVSLICNLTPKTKDILIEIGFHRDELLDNWKKAQQAERLKKIRPLE